MGACLHFALEARELDGPDSMNAYMVVVASFANTHDRDDTYALHEGLWNVWM